MPTPFDNFSFSPSIGGDEGVARVNADTGNTGVVAYKDDRGQTVLTNLAIDSTGKETKIGANLSTSTTGTASTGPTFTTTPDVRSSLFEGLSKLRVSNNPSEATALYDSLIQSLTTEMARLESDAQSFAQSKYSVPELQKSLLAARQADKADPMYSPGMGDSPITQKIVVEMRQAGESARAEASQFLKTNMTWNSLATLKQQADREIQRIQKVSDQQENLRLNKQLAQENAQVQAIYQSQIRREDREERRKEELLFGFNKLNSTQIRNISLLSADEIGGLQDGSEEKKIRISELAFGNKDKAFTAAIAAEQPHEQLALALQGNTYSRKLIIAEESERLGLSTQEVDGMIKNLTTRLANPKMAVSVIQKMESNPTKREQLMAELNAGRLDLSKKAGSDQLRIALLMQENQGRLQDIFDNDVGTWRVKDPMLQTMITTGLEKAKKVAGKTDIKNVLAAILDDGPDDQRIVKTQMFLNAMQSAAERYQGSAFGQPNWIRSKSLVEREGIAQGWFTRAIKKQAQNLRESRSDNPFDFL